jgi:hypothetical protein
MRNKPLTGAPMKQKNDEGDDFNPLARDSKKDSFLRRNLQLEQNKELVAKKMEREQLTTQRLQVIKIQNSTVD